MWKAMTMGFRLIIVTVLAVLVPFIFSLTGRAQSPTDSKLEVGTYLNSYFKLAYTWPKDQTPTVLHLTEPEAPETEFRKHEFLLFASKQGNQPYGVIMLAEPLGIGTPRMSPIRDSSDYLNRITRTWNPTGNGKVLKRSRTTNTSGLTFEEMDYTVYGEHDAALVTQIGQYLIVFKCNASSPEALAAMIRTVIATKKSSVPLDSSRTHTGK
jgi:hypothetical protein